MIFRPNDLEFEPALCLRAASSVNRCEDCVHICTLNALSIKQDRIEIEKDKCVSCGACVGICKPDAFSLKSFNIPTFIAWATKQNNHFKLYSHQTQGL